jgi:hypothetical protein
VVTGAIRSVISGVCVAIGFIFGRVLGKSLVDAMRSWGVVGTLLFCLFSGGITLGMYIKYGIDKAVCSVVVILCIHTAFWCIGYFRHE